MAAHEDFMPWPELEIKLAQLEHAAAAEDEAAIRTVLKHCVHGFHEELAAGGGVLN